MTETIKHLPEDLYPTSMECSLEFNNIMYVSPFNNRIQIEERAGEQWVLRFRYDELEMDEMKRLQAFIVSLRGVAGLFYARDYAFYEMGGSMTGNPKVDGTDNYGGVCKIKDCPPNREVFKAGDYVKIQSRLHMITEDIRSDFSGKAVLKFQPKMLSVPSENSSVIYNDFTIICRLKDDKQGKRSSVDTSNSLTFDCVEVV